MARTKQTARKSTSGRMPQQIDFPFAYDTATVVPCGVRINLKHIHRAVFKTLALRRAEQNLRLTFCLGLTTPKPAAASTSATAAASSVDVKTEGGTGTPKRKQSASHSATRKRVKVDTSSAAAAAANAPATAATVSAAVSDAKSVVPPILSAFRSSPIYDRNVLSLIFGFANGVTDTADRDGTELVVPNGIPKLKPDSGAATRSGSAAGGGGTTHAWEVAKSERYPDTSETSDMTSDERNAVVARAVGDELIRPNNLVEWFERTAFMQKRRRQLVARVRAHLYSEWEVYFTDPEHEPQPPGNNSEWGFTPRMCDPAYTFNPRPGAYQRAPTNAPPGQYEHMELSPDFVAVLPKAEAALRAWVERERAAGRVVDEPYLLSPVTAAAAAAEGDVKSNSATATAAAAAAAGGGATMQRSNSSASGEPVEVEYSFDMDRYCEHCAPFEMVKPNWERRLTEYEFFEKYAHVAFPSAVRVEPQLTKPEPAPVDGATTRAALDTAFGTAKRKVPAAAIAAAEKRRAAINSPFELLSDKSVVQDDSRYHYATFNAVLVRHDMSAAYDADWLSLLKLFRDSAFSELHRAQLAVRIRHDYPPFPGQTSAVAAAFTELSAVDTTSVAAAKNVPSVTLSAPLYRAPAMPPFSRVRVTSREGLNLYAGAKRTFDAAPSSEKPKAKPKAKPKRN